MEQIDFKLKLIGGRPIVAEGYGEIRPLLIREIIDFGYSEYLVSLNLLNLDTDDFLVDDKKLHDEELKEEDKPCVLDVIIAFGGDELCEKLEEALSLFLSGEAIVDRDNLQVIVSVSDSDVRIVNRDNYDSIRNVIKYQNFILNFSEEKVIDFKPIDEKTRKFKERMEELKKKRDAIKKKQNDEGEEGDLDLYKILSAISSKSYGLNEMEAMELTIYQVYTKFKRLDVIDQYDISIKTILAGGKDVKIKHWST